MRFTLNIDCDNAAFGDDGFEAGAEVARILCVLAADVEDGIVTLDESPRVLRDRNGNRVGIAEVDAS